MFLFIVFVVLGAVVAYFLEPLLFKKKKEEGKGLVGLESSRVEYSVSVVVARIKEDVKVCKETQQKILKILQEELNIDINGKPKEKGKIIPRKKEGKKEVVEIKEKEEKEKGKEKEEVQEKDTLVQEIKPSRFEVEAKKALEVAKHYYNINSGWEIFKEDNGTRMESLKMDGEDYYCYKLTASCPDLTPAQLATHLWNMREKEWKEVESQVKTFEIVEPLDW
eukprot:CAMPEP_0174255524 /NCGR_PEP_ID=MMETSP0439-20130205/4851_1 /TAXON_ID=0 /ORGANISM="Stereomyxa ramosa, Strain Chinc5" /LENGTH=221 /DNA_ID=CAMNT_0015337747 /DNA_START=59 /DNA_END=721 /DNA_ORIENTATION=-